MKKIISLLMAQLLSLTLSVSALAADPVEEENAAWTLYHLGLFRGTDTDSEGFPVFSLDDALTRAQGVTMLVRLLGQEEAALEGNWETPFLDVPDWAAPYVGYAYENELTTGRDETTFDPDTRLSATEYLTFVLRALGYQSGKDFVWDAAWKLSDRIGLTDGSYHEETNQTFDRGDAAVISANALDTKQKNKKQTLGEKLAEQGIATDAQRCLWTENCESIQPDQIWFSFTALADSPEVYASFVVDSVTANGVPCQITQYTTAKEVKAFREEQELAETYLKDCFALTCLDYDEKAALEAAPASVVQGGIEYPILEFRFRCTGTLADGTETSEIFLLKSYIAGYGGPLV